jgi:nicotinamide mononucleotide transporter
MTDIDFVTLSWNYLQQNTLEVFAAFVSIVAVWLNTRGDVRGLWLGIVGIVPYIWIFLREGLYGDFLLNIVYLLMSFYGIWYWKFGGKSKEEAPITKSKLQEQFSLIGLCALTTLGLGYWFSTLEGASLPYWDATTTAFAFGGQWLLSKKRLENWLWWILINTLCVGIYYYKGLYATTGLHLVLLILAFMGYRRWKVKIM